MDKINALLNMLRDVLQGEPLRAITYGAIVVVFLVTQGAVLLGFQPSAPSLDAILLAVAAASAALTEFARRFVYSPNTVAAIQAGTALSVPPANLVSPIVTVVGP